MRKAWLAVRSAVLWLISGIHFLFAVLFIVLISIFFGQRRIDPVVRVVRPQHGAAGGAAALRCGAGRGSIPSA